MTRIEIAPNVFLTQAAGNYKRSRLSIFMASPLGRENLTATAMLPFLLERGTASLPDMTLLKRRQDALYGANISTSYATVGCSRVIEGYAEGVDERLLADAHGLAAQRTQLLLDVLFDPFTENGAFREDWMDIEREKLRETICSVINDKREYCAQLLAAAFYDDARGLPVDGFVEDLDAIDGKRLYVVYQDVVRSSSLEILYVGSPNTDLAPTLARRIASLQREAVSVPPVTAVPVREEQVVTRTLDMEQDKLALAFTCGRALQDSEIAVLRVACALLGASPFSRLFLNVREKQSLCYYASAQPMYKAAGGLVIDSGVDHSSAAQAKEAILQELHLLATDGPTETEMEQARLLFQNILRGVSDSSAALSSYLYSNIIRYHRAMRAQEELEMLGAVTAGQVRDLLAEMHLNTTCHLRKKEGDA